VAPADAAPVSLQTIATAYGDYAKKSFEDTKSFVEKLSGVKSIDKAVEAQTEFARSAYETFVAESQKIAGLYTDLAKQAFKPLEGAVAKFSSLVEGQIGHGSGYAGELSHGCPADQNRDHCDVVRERGLNLVTDEVALRLLRTLPQDLHPSGADDGVHSATGRDRPIDGLSEVLPRRDVFDVHEDAIGAKLRSEMIGYPAGVSGRVLTAVADENIARGSLSRAILARLWARKWTVKRAPRAAILHSPDLELILQM